MSSLRPFSTAFFEQEGLLRRFPLLLVPNQPSCRPSSRPASCPHSDAGAGHRTGVTGPPSSRPFVTPSLSPLLHALMPACLTFLQQTWSAFCSEASRQPLVSARGTTSEFSQLSAPWPRCLLSGLTFVAPQKEHLPLAKPVSSFPHMGVMVLHLCCLVIPAL